MTDPESSASEAPVLKYTELDLEERTQAVIRYTEIRYKKLLQNQDDDILTFAEKVMILTCAARMEFECAKRSGNDNLHELYGRTIAYQAVYHKLLELVDTNHEGLEARIAKKRYEKQEERKIP